MKKVKEQVKPTEEVVSNEIVAVGDKDIINPNSALTVKEETLPEKKTENALGEPHRSGGYRRAEDREDFSAFYELAKLLNKSVGEIKDECCMFQIKNLMGKLGKVIVRDNLTEGDIITIINNVSVLGISETVISPAYLPVLVKSFKKSNLEDLIVYGLMDFPFGESALKSKIIDVREALKKGVDGFTMMTPVMLICKEKIKEFKKQVKKMGKLRKGYAGIGLSAMDMTEEQIKLAVKTVEKSRCSHITFVFSKATYQEIRDKFQIIEKYKSKKLKIKILGDVAHVEDLVELFKMGAETVLTRYADDIGAELVRRFGVKCVKLA